MFVDNYSSATAGVGGYFTARCSANSTLCWGINPQVTDIASLTGVVMYGQENDVGVLNAGTAVTGEMVLGDFFAQPQGAWAYRVSSKSSTYRWKSGYTTDDGSVLATGSGLGLGATSTASNSYSQILSLSGINTSGVHEIAYLQATPSGGMNLSTSTGTFFGFYNGPVALSTLGASTSSNACLNGTTYSGLYVISLCTSFASTRRKLRRLRPAFQRS